ncbi:MAG TPA: 16S rRNA (cytosine(967)-C(5))-methyltransferase RsmB [Xanthomonadales bacterium]|nr:16S rRNA (cytosine(967)-C(5))-methyltransferase RsmB [Xanthomonadales bacterium]
MTATTDPGGKVRAAAAGVLARVIEGHALDAELPAADKGLRDPRDRALLRAILFAALRRFYRLDAMLARLLTQPLAALDRRVHALLLTGLAQLDAELTPPYAAVSGTVDAARVLGRTQLAGLVNAVMRRFQREAVALAAELPDDDQVRHDHPRWLLDLIKRDWPDDWQRIVAANNAPAPMWLRANRRRNSRDAYRDVLAAVEIAADVSDLHADALRLRDPVDPNTLPGFAEGDVSVQDGAPQLAVDVLAPAPGNRVLDACAAPGGKTAHILEREPRIDSLLALDVKKDRAELVRATLKRLKLGATVKVGDATKPAAWWDGKPYDRILVDAPCSGTGVIRRHPDIRLLRRAGDVAALTALQDALLDALWPMLAPGGRLVYATCSVLSDENERRIAAFLERTPGAVALDAVPPGFGRSTGHGRQNLPGDGDMDGFYYAVLAHRPPAP